MDDVGKLLQNKIGQSIRLCFPSTSRTPTTSQPPHTNEPRQMSITLSHGLACCKTPASKYTPLQPQPLPGHNSKVTKHRSVDTGCRGEQRGVWIQPDLPFIDRGKSRFPAMHLFALMRVLKQCACPSSLLLQNPTEAKQTGSDRTHPFGRWTTLRCHEKTVVAPTTFQGGPPDEVRGEATSS